MQKDEPGFAGFAKHYKEIKSRYDITNYDSIDEFYENNNITSDEHYHKILCAGINRPRIFLKRIPNEKWHNAFNPFIFNVLQSNMDIQFILDEYSCAMYVVDYVNKSNRGISNLQRKILEITEEFPDFNVVEMTRKMSVDLLNSVEMSSQEAAWWLLRKPMSEASSKVIFIPTSWPTDRHRLKKAQKALAELDDESTDIWKENVFDKYEQRPQELEEITLAQFCAQYTCRANGEYHKSNKSKIIRYTNYNMTTQFDEYKREMVTLHIPFRSEELEILSESKFLQIYTENHEVILQRRLEFESNINIEETLRLCEQLYREEEILHQPGNQQIPGIIPEPVPFNDMYADPNSEINDDLRQATLSRLQSIAKRRENLMPNEDFCKLMRSTNHQQRSILLEIIHHLTFKQDEPLRIFLTGPAGCGKTFVIRLMLELYNKYATTEAHSNAYLTCASTGKAAVAINGTTIHTALSLSTGVDNALSAETLHQFRSVFQHIRVVIIDEVSMVGAELLERVDRRLKVITGKTDIPFGGFDVILVGDLRQLPPVKATPIFKQSKHYIGSQTWRSFKFHELTEVMRQSNVTFSTILTQIGNGDRLSEDEIALIESRFVTEDEANALCPNGIRLAYSNKTVDKYNEAVLGDQQNQVICKAIDFISGCENAEQQQSARKALENKKLADTGGLHQSLALVLHKVYIITTNICVADGLANGAMGELNHIERNEEGEITRLWLIFPTTPMTGRKARAVARTFMRANNINPCAVPLTRRNATIYLNRQRSISAKRNNFPIAPACALTIHKSQGGTFDAIVYYYERSHPQQLVYVAMSRATSIEGLYIIPVNKQKKFYHGYGNNDRSCVALRNEMIRLRQNPRKLLEQDLYHFLRSRERGLSVISFNCQSLRAHSRDMTDRVIRNSSILMLSETFMNSNEPAVSVPNFNFIVRFQRNEKRNSGVAIYHNQEDQYHIVTPHLNIEAPYSSEADVTVSTSPRIGDICAVECNIKDNVDRPQKLILIAVYISPNTAMRDIKLFLGKSLLSLSRAGSEALADIVGEPVTDYDQAVLLAGDFNVNFSLPEAQPLLEFHQDKFSFKMINGRDDPTTKGGTTIDAVFARNFDKIELKHFVSYFSYHNPIVSVIDLNSPLMTDVT